MEPRRKRRKPPHHKGHEVLSVVRFFFVPFANFVVTLFLISDISVVNIWYYHDEQPTEISQPFLMFRAMV